MPKNFEKASFDPGVTRASIFLRLQASDTRLRETSWSEFSEKYCPFLRGYGGRLGFSGADLDDLVQQVLVGFFGVSPRFEYDPSKGRFRGYLTWAIRAAASKMRRGHHPQPLGDYDPAGPEDAGAVEVWDRVALTRALNEVRLEVDPHTFEAFELYAQRGVPAEEVARQLDLSVDSVHQAKSRVGRKVKDAFVRYRDEDLSTTPST
jgi:RNA polymerase sigma-70 factor (ECF subfamily)